MRGITSFIRNLFGSDSSTKPVEDPDAILEGTDSRAGVIDIRDDLIEWRTQYAQDFTDFLTVQEAIQRYDEATTAIDRLEPLLEQPDAYDDAVVDAAQTLEQDLSSVTTFIEQRDDHNDEWVDEMVAAHGPELNSYFENPEHEHTDQQFRAIFSNDNYNRVNAAAGTGKTRFPAKSTSEQHTTRRGRKPST